MAGKIDFLTALFEGHSTPALLRTLGQHPGSVVKLPESEMLHPPAVFEIRRSAVQNRVRVASLSVFGHVCVPACLFRLRPMLLCAMSALCSACGLERQVLCAFSNISSVQSAIEKPAKARPRRTTLDAHKPLGQQSTSHVWASCG